MWTKENLKTFVDENGIKTVKGLRDKSVTAYKFAKTNSLYDELGLVLNSNESSGGEKKKYAGKPRHNINLVWAYLYRWALEEGTTIKKQAIKYDYEREYNAFCREHGNPDNDISLISKYLPPAYQESQPV